MSSSKRQSMIITGICLIILSGIILYFGLSLPRVSESALNNVSLEETVSQDKPSSNDQTTAVQAQTNDTQAANITQSEAVSITVNYPLDLNKCTREELATISGIGEARADAIVQYREYLGGYTSVDQIKNIKGIGDSLYEKVAPYLTV